MAIIDILIYFKDIFLLWLTIFIAPLENLNMLWILLPVIVNWGFTEFYQEKKGTSLGNAITNGVVALLVSVDWLKTTISSFTEKQIGIWILLAYLTISLLMAIYGIFIIIWGIKLKKRVKYIGRIREVTYLTLMFTPIIYGIIPLNFRIILGIILFFPIFYFLVAILDRFIPDPHTYEDEQKENNYKDKLFTDIENQPSTYQTQQFNYPKL
ncbi:MAG: hypothetical protein AABY14_04830 [Nanoarchaeota archaeon]